MQTLTVVWEALVHALCLVWEPTWHLLVFLRTSCQSRCRLAAEIVALRSQAAAGRDRVERKQLPKPPFSAASRVLAVVLSRFMKGWEDLAQLMKPATVKRWRRASCKLYWRWTSRRRGRPSLDQGMRAVIRRLSREDPLWSAERIRDTLLLLGYPPVCDDTVREYMVKRPKPREPSTT